MRRNLQARLLPKKFEEQREAIYKEFAALAEDCYIAYMGPSDLKLVSAMRPGFCANRSSIRVDFSGTFRELLFDGYYSPGRRSWCRPEDRKRFHKPFPADKVGGALRVGAQDELCVRFRRLSNDLEALEKAEGKLKSELWAFLKSHRTVSSLTKAWPELAPHLDIAEKSAASVQLVVRVEELKKQISPLPEAK